WSGRPAARSGQYRAGLLDEVPYRCQAGVRGQPLGQPGKVVDGPGRVQALGRHNGLRTDNGRLLDLASLSVCRGEQCAVDLPAAHVPGVHVQRPDRELAGKVTAIERGEAVPELGRQVRLVEVADPLGILATVGPVERPLRPVQRDGARLLVAGSRMAVGFEN